MGKSLVSCFFETQCRCAALVVLLALYSYWCAHAGTIAEGAPIIPISAQLKYNVDAVCEYIVKKIPVPIRDFTSEPRLIGEFVTCKFVFSLCTHKHV